MQCATCLLFLCIWSASLGRFSHGFSQGCGNAQGAMAMCVLRDLVFRIVVMRDFESLDAGMSIGQLTDYLVAKLDTAEENGYCRRCNEVRQRDFRKAQRSGDRSLYNPRFMDGAAAKCAECPKCHTRYVFKQDSPWIGKRPTHGGNEHRLFCLCGDVSLFDPLKLSRYLVRAVSCFVAKLIFTELCPILCLPANPTTCY